MDGINCLLCLNLMQTLSFSSTGYCYRCRRPRVWHTALLSVWRLQHGRPPSSVPDPPTHRRVVCVSGYRPRLRADGPRHPDQSWGPSGWTFHFDFQAGNISSFGSHLPTRSVFYIIFFPHDREAWALRPTCTSRWRTWMITLRCSTQTSTPWASAATRSPEPRSSTSSLQTETRAGSVTSPMNSSLGTCPVFLHWINKLVCGHNNNTHTFSTSSSQPVCHSVCISQLYLYFLCICISFFTPTGQCRWLPFSVWVWSRFLPTASFLLPLPLHSYSGGLLVFSFNCAKHFETPLDVISESEYSPKNSKKSLYKLK